MPFDIFSLPKDRRDVLEEIYFRPKYEKRGPDECWPWLGQKNLFGYGRFTKRFGKRKQDKYNFTAHRLAWSLEYNVPVPEGLDCCHTCDNPPCVNPKHIFIATHIQNMRDAVMKRRLKKLENSK